MFLFFLFKEKVYSYKPIQINKLFFCLQWKSLPNDKLDFQNQHERILIYSLANIYAESLMLQRCEGKQSRKKIKFDECGQWRSRHEVSSISSWELPLRLLPFCLLQPCSPTYFPLPSTLPLPPLLSFPPFLSTFSLLHYIPTQLFPFLPSPPVISNYGFSFLLFGFLPFLEDHTK